MGLEELERLREEIKEYRMEIKELRVEIKDMDDSYKVGHEQYFTEYQAVKETLNEIKTLLYNDAKTGQTGLIQNFSNMKIEVSQIGEMLKKLIGDKDSKRRKLIKIWSIVSGGTIVAWTVFKEFWHQLFHWLKLHL